MPSYGFIITRHVNSEKTNKYWNTCVKCIRHFYPFIKIVIIDDNSNQEFINSTVNMENILIINSEFPKRGELLPYFYFYKNKFFENAVIIHDSVFFHRRINFEKLNGISVLPLWHFNPDKENLSNTHRITNFLNNNNVIQRKISLNDLNILGMSSDRWYGCFGVQSYINHNFLVSLQNKYNIVNMINGVFCRKDRCSLERIFGSIFFTECNNIIRIKSLLGNIMKYQNWGYTYDNYEKDLYKNKKLPKRIIKVWTGR
jgi:hypothetical protein